MTQAVRYAGVAAPMMPGIPYPTPSSSAPMPAVALLAYALPNHPRAADLCQRGEHDEWD